MKKEIIHQFRGFGRVPSSCVVRIIREDDKNLICFINTNEGTSVTNASEQLASEIVAKCQFDPSDCRFFEWYPEYNEGVDEITYDWTLGIARNPNWKPFCTAENNPFKK